MGHLLKTVNRVHKQINPNLKIGGVLLTLVDKRTNLSRDVRNTLAENYGQYVKKYDTEIPKAINTAKATSTGKSIFEFDKNSSVALAYENLAKEVLDNGKTRTKNELLRRTGTGYCRECLQTADEDDGGYTRSSERWFIHVCIFRQRNRFELTGLCKFCWFIYGILLQTPHLQLHQ